MNYWIMMIFGIGVNLAWAKAPESCMQSISAFDDMSSRSECGQYRKFSKIQLNVDCQLFRVSDLDTNQRSSLEKLVRRFSIRMDDLDHLNSVIGSLKVYALKRLSQCSTPSVVKEINEKSSLQNKKPRLLQELLVDAIKKGQIEKVKELIAMKANPNKPRELSKGVYEWPLFEGAKAGQYEILRYLRDETLIKPHSKIKDQKTLIDLMNEEVENCKKNPSHYPPHFEERVSKSIRILVNYE